MKKTDVSASRDSGFHSLECDLVGQPGPGEAKLTIFMLGKIYRWIVKAKLVAMFSKSFMMGKPGEKSEAGSGVGGREMPKMKNLLLMRRRETLTAENLAFPDPASNIDEEDTNLEDKSKEFENPILMKKWMERSHGNNELSRKLYRPPNPGNITNTITTLQSLPSGQHFMNPPNQEQIYKNRSTLITPRKDVPRVRSKCVERKEFSSKTNSRRSKRATEKIQPPRPAFITCTHPVSKCRCVRRSGSTEKLKPPYQPLLRTKSVNSIKSGSPLELSAMVTKTKSPTDYYSCMWDTMVDTAARGLYQYQDTVSRVKTPHVDKNYL